MTWWWNPFTAAVCFGVTVWAVVAFCMYALSKWPAHARWAAERLAAAQSLHTPSIRADYVEGALESLEGIPEPVREWYLQRAVDKLQRAKEAEADAVERKAERAKMAREIVAKMSEEEP